MITRPLPSSAPDVEQLDRADVMHGFSTLHSQATNEVIVVESAKGMRGHRPTRSRVPRCRRRPLVHERRLRSPGHRGCRRRTNGEAPLLPQLRPVQQRAADPARRSAPSACANGHDARNFLLRADPRPTTPRSRSCDATTIFSAGQTKRKSLRGSVATMVRRSLPRA